MIYSFGRRIMAVLPLIAAFAALFSCAAQPPRFHTSQDEMQQRETRGYRASNTLVWQAVLEVVNDYKIFKKDPSQGLILTDWREKLTKDSGIIGGTWIHGVKVEDRADTQDKRDMREFVIKNRLHIIVTGNADSTTVSVTNYFTARPKDFSGRAGNDVDYGNKSYSVSDFDTREQFVVLNRIGEEIEKARK